MKLLGVGSPLVDYPLAVSETLLSELVPGGKGCTRNITAEDKNRIISRIPGEILRFPGGSAANTMRIFSALGGVSSLFGKAGNDEEAEFFGNELIKSGVDDSLLIKDREKSTGFCLSLITPDAERTMLSDLAASREISSAEIENIDFTRFDWLLLEGYLSCEKWIPHLLKKAEDAGCKIALDLNNFELVSRELENFMQLTANGIDLLLGNEEEVAALFPGKTSAELPAMLRLHYPISVLKKGADGALIVTADQEYDIPAQAVTAVKDTTGAGDFFAGGFFFGMSRNYPLPVCGRIGALCAAAVIEGNGTLLSDKKINFLKQYIDKEVMP